MEMSLIVGKCWGESAEVGSFLDTSFQVVSRLVEYWTRSPHSCPIYLFIGHVALILGQYIHLLDTLPTFLSNISIYWTRCSHSWPISAFIGHVATILGQYIRLLPATTYVLANTRPLTVHRAPISHLTK